MKKLFSLVLVLVLCFALLPTNVLAAGAAPSELVDVPLGLELRVTSTGRYTNWAGRSTVSQFADENGLLCLAWLDGDTVTIARVDAAGVRETLQLPKEHSKLGSAICDKDGNIYLVWGEDNEGSDTGVHTIFVSKYSRTGELLATVGGNGSEGLYSYYGSGFYTQYPFDAGNCDVAISGNVLLVNYARQMYSGHQSNGVFAVNLDTMTVNTAFKSYNSHSFDQRVTAYAATGGFLLTSQGDCFPRAFRTDLTSASATLSSLETFHFWVQKDAYADYDMWKLNPTYARLGNILDTGKGAALVGASARGLDETAMTGARDVFVQVFDPKGTGGKDDYLTSGQRSGMGGNNGDTPTTDYGVKWLTDLEEVGGRVDVVQAVTLDSGHIVVLYELQLPKADMWGDVYTSYDSTWYMVLDAEGNVVREAQSLGETRLNVDEDPVALGETVQWVSDPGAWDDALVLHILTPDTKPHVTIPSHGILPESTGVAFESSQQVFVDGVAVDFQMYQLANPYGATTNYVKLRDLAYVLNGTPASFNVDWTKARGIFLTTGVPYTTTTESDMQKLYSGKQDYQQYAGDVDIDGVMTSLAAFALFDGRYTYFNLRDLGQALGFNVCYDRTLRCVIVETDRPYDGTDR